ncbi:hypothetical protein [Streptomyces cyaneofuscatus]|uniref:hypothetical protein n=1 Tax=Streptomyces cyaneofuscatus TaxID=66883 RepID=UPI002FEE988F
MTIPTGSCAGAIRIPAQTAHRIVPDRDPVASDINYLKNYRNNPTQPTPSRT